MYHWIVIGCIVYAVAKLLRYVLSKQDHGTGCASSERDLSLGSPSRKQDHGTGCASLERDPSHGSPSGEQDHGTCCASSERDPSHGSPSGEQDHGTGGVFSERDPSHEAPSRNTSDRSSRRENNDPFCQSDRTQIRYYDYYPNLPTSSSTTKGHSDVPLQSESSSKSTEERDQSFENHESLNNSCKPKPSVPQHASASSKPFQSPIEPPPSSSDQPRSSAKPTLSPIRSDPTNPQTKADYPLDSENKQKRGNHILADKGTSPVCMTPKNNENLAKKESAPEGFKKPSPLSQKAPSSSKPTISQLPPDSTSQQEKDLSKPSVPQHASASSKPFQSATEPPPSSSDQPRSSAKPTLSPIRSNPTNPQTKADYPMDSENKQKRGNHILAEKGTSPACMTPKDNENLAKKEAAPEGFKKPSPLSQKAPSSSKPTISPLPPDSTNRQEKDLNKPSVPQHASFSSKPFQSPTEPPPSSSDQPRSSAKPTLSPIRSNPTNPQTKADYPVDSENKQKRGNHILAEKGTSPACMTPKDNENLAKKEAVPEGFKKPSPLSQKPPSSSKPTLSPLPPDSTNQQEKDLSKPSVPQHASTSSKPFQSPTEPPPASSDQPRSSAKPTLSPIRSNPTNHQTKAHYPTDSKNNQKRGNHILAEKGTSSVYMTPKDDENLTKKEAVPEVFEKPSPLSQKAPSSSKPTLSPLPTDSTNPQEKDNYIWAEKGTSPIYKIPKDIEDLIKKDIVPDVLKKPLSPFTYKDYFAVLLYAEDFYNEKWSGFQLLNITLELREAAIYDESLKSNHLKKSHQKDFKFFVAFEIDSIPERRPFLLSRDFIYAQRSGGKSKKFQGRLHRVVNSTTVLVEFEEGFYPQHRSSHKYDISFSFNRVCLKRAHQAIEAASDPLFHNCLFPDCASRKSVTSSAPQFYYNYKLDSDINSAVCQILSIEGQPPYLVEGPPLCVFGERSLENEYVAEFELSETGIVVREAVLQICQCSPKSRILICAPTNRTCDVLMKNLMEDIPESDVFRANAAFREVDEVPDDILQASLWEGECFSCPSLQELRQFRVIFSTFVSSFRLHNEGITAGHFSHIFLVDASFAIEPETIIALSNLANENTTVIVTGDPWSRPNWVRSDIARGNGLKISYFERLSQTKTYWSGNQMFYTLLAEESDISD